MRLTRPPRRQHPETIVALIDVVFFLLVFFMLIGRLDASAPFAIVPPVGTTGTDLPAGGITVSISTDGALALDGVAMDRDALAVAIADRLVRSPDVLIRVNADKTTQLSHVLPIVSALEQLGAKDVALIVTPSGP
jgi:biopolymer transport protein ExbD